VSTVLRDLGACDEGARFRKLAEVLWTMALDGQLPAIKEIIERLEPRERGFGIGVGGSSGGLPAVRIVIADHIIDPNSLRNEGNSDESEIS
jgi:hypothetical protein